MTKEDLLTHALKGTPLALELKELARNAKHYVEIGLIDAIGIPDSRKTDRVLLVIKHPISITNANKSTHLFDANYQLILTVENAEELIALTYDYPA